MDEGKFTGAIYIDLSKAFNTISHSSLLQKLSKFGIEGMQLQWFTDYLFCRKQHVSCDGIKSDPHFIQCGVPQGSILGPLLFLLHFNDSADILSHCHIVKYADDTVLYFSHKSVEVIERNLNEDLATFTSWLETNELVINLKKGKTEYMLFGSGKSINKLNDPPMNIQYRGTQVNFTTTYKYLGITIKPTLNMSHHFTLIYKKASSRVNLLKQIRYFINADTALNIYRSMIVPLLTYCPLIISHLNQTQRDKIIRLESRAQKIVCKWDVVHFPKVAKIQQKPCLSYVYKCIRNDVCENFENYFQLMNNSIKTRNNDIILRLPKVKTEAAKKGFFFAGAKMFNQLPANIISYETLYIFKKQIDLNL